MPEALLTSCSEPGCPELTTGGPCPSHQRRREEHRGSAHARGYTRGWERFKEWFIQKLIAAGIMPACGARWPGEPGTGDSLCQTAGRMTAVGLHLDHTPPLTDAERKDARIVCDVHRVQLLCEPCHNAKSARERASGR